VSPPGDDHADLSRRLVPFSLHSLSLHLPSRLTIRVAPFTPFTSPHDSPFASPHSIPTPPLPGPLLGAQSVAAKREAGPWQTSLEQHSEPSYRELIGILLRADIPRHVIDANSERSFRELFGIHLDAASAPSFQHTPADVASSYWADPAHSR
jgi:hypothetical protein